MKRRRESHKLPTKPRWKSWEISEKRRKKKEVIQVWHFNRRNSCNTSHRIQLKNKWTEQFQIYWKKIEQTWIASNWIKVYKNERKISSANWTFTSDHGIPKRSQWHPHVVFRRSNDLNENSEKFRLQLLEHLERYITLREASDFCPQFEHFSSPIRISRLEWRREFLDKKKGKSNKKSFLRPPLTPIAGNKERELFKRRKKSVAPVANSK